MKDTEHRKITIYDIAKEAGVSAATVSRVLTNNAGVSADKRDRVLMLIEKYNFKRNALAKGLSDTRRKVIGIIAADIRNPFYARLYVACETAAKSMGYMVVLCNSFGERQAELSLLDMFDGQMVDAIILLGGGVDDLETNALFKTKIAALLPQIPVISTGKVDDTDAYSVQINPFKVIDLLMQHLVELGHTNIALLGGREDVVSTNAKIREYIHLHEVYGLELRKEYIVPGEYNHESGYNAMKTLLGLPERPTAVIAINDFSAAGALRCLHDSGLRVPEDISLVSQDNTYISTYMVPSLTSVDYNYDKFGEILINTAIDAVEGEKPKPLQRIEPVLFIRESSGKPLGIH